MTPRFLFATVLALAVPAAAQAAALAYGELGDDVFTDVKKAMKDAVDFAKFKGARLPSESEWEYAATSGGKNWKYPWGNDAPTCGDKNGKNGNAVMFGNGGNGCGSNGTMPVCSKPAGNTKIDGLPANKQLCDMTGNVWEWVQDKYQSSYANTPPDGSAVEAGSLRVMRGGSSGSEDAGYLRADRRASGGPAYRGEAIGFRLARSSL